MYKYAVEHTSNRDESFNAQANPKHQSSNNMAKGLVSDRLPNDAEQIVYTALKRREHSGATDAIRHSEIRGYIYQQKTGSYLPAEKANTTAETRRKIPAQVDLERVSVACFFRKENNLTQNSLHKVSSAEKLRSYSRGEIANSLHGYEMPDPRKLSQKSQHLR